MSVSDHPDWPLYKAALARVAQASVLLLELEAASPAREQAEQEFQDAMRAYEEVRHRLNEPDRSGRR